MRAALLFLAVACTPTGGEPPPVEVELPAGPLWGAEASCSIRPRARLMPPTRLIAPQAPQRRQAIRCADCCIP